MAQSIPVEGPWYRYPGDEPGLMGWRVEGGGARFFRVPAELVPYAGKLGAAMTPRVFYHEPRNRWLWILDDPDAFHPYFDMELYYTPEEDDDTPEQEAAAEMRAAIQGMERRLWLLASELFHVDPGEVSWETTVATATRLKSDGRVKESRHVVIRVRYQDTYLLLAKHQIKQLVQDLGSPAIDPAVYHRGMQLYRTIYSTTPGDADGSSEMVPQQSYYQRLVMMTILCVCRHHLGLSRELTREVAHAHWWGYYIPSFCPIWRANPANRGARCLVPTDEVLQTETSVVLAPAAAARPAQRRVRAPAPQHEQHERGWAELVEAYYQQVMTQSEREEPEISYLLPIPPRLNWDVNAVAYPIPPELRYRVCFYDTSFDHYTSYLPVDAIGGPGTGTYAVYFATLTLAVRLHARPQWIHFCRERVPRTRCPDPGRAFDEQLARVRERSIAGAALAGIPAYVNQIKELLQIEVPYYAHVHQEPPQDAQCTCRTSVELACYPVPNGAMNLFRVCRTCRRVRALGQLHRHMRYPNPRWVSVPDVADTMDQIRQSLTEMETDLESGTLGSNKQVLAGIVPCGMGKTKAAVQYVSEKLHDRRVIIIPLITCALVDFWIRSLRDAVPEHARICCVHSKSQDDLSWLRDPLAVLPHVVVVTPESLYKVVGALDKTETELEYGLSVILDEASKTLMHFNSATMQSKLRVHLDRFARLLQQANTVMMMDADMSLWTCQTARKLMPRHTFTTLVNTHAKRSDREARVTFSERRFLLDLVNSVAQCVRQRKAGLFLVFSTTKRFVKQFQERLVCAVDARRLGPSVSVDAFTADNPLPDDLDSERLFSHARPGVVEVLLFSPVVSSGVSWILPAQLQEQVVVRTYIECRDGKFLTAIQQSQRLRTATPLTALVQHPAQHEQTVDHAMVSFDAVGETMRANREEDLLGIPEEQLDVLKEAVGNERWSQHYPMYFILYGLLVREGMHVRLLPRLSDEERADYDRLMEGMEEDRALALAAARDTFLPALELHEKTHVNTAFAVRATGLQWDGMTERQKQLLQLAVANPFTRFFCYVVDPDRFAPFLGPHPLEYGQTSLRQVREVLWRFFGALYGEERFFSNDACAAVEPDALPELAGVALGDQDALRVHTDALNMSELQEVAYAYTAFWTALVKLRRGAGCKKPLTLVRKAAAVVGLNMHGNGLFTTGQRAFLAQAFELPGTRGLENTGRAPPDDPAQLHEPKRWPRWSVLPMWHLKQWGRPQHSEYWLYWEAGEFLV